MELKKIYNTVCETNDKKIKSGEKVKATCIIFINDEQKIYDFELTEKNRKTIAEKLKSRILQHGAQGYILILDTITEKRDKKNSTIIQGECINRTLYTATERISEYVWYTGTEILGKDRIEGRDNMYDTWDAWNTGDIQIQKKPDIYALFKKYGMKPPKGLGEKND